MAVLCSGQVAVGDRQASVLAEGFWRDLDSGRSLAAFVLTVVNHTHYFPDHVSIGAACSDLLWRLVLFNIRLQNGVKDRIRRQGVFIFLVGSEFCRWRSFKDAARDKLWEIMEDKGVSLEDIP